MVLNVRSSFYKNLFNIRFSRLVSCDKRQNLISLLRLVVSVVSVFAHIGSRLVLRRGYIV